MASVGLRRSTWPVLRYPIVSVPSLRGTVVSHKPKWQVVVYGLSSAFWDIFSCILKQDAHDLLLRDKRAQKPFSLRLFRKGSCQLSRGCSARGKPVTSLKARS